MKNILTSLVLLLAVNLQAQTITVDGTPMLVSSDTSFPFWLQSGSSISPEPPVSSISILEFNIVSNANGNDMVFNQVLSVSSIATVPEGKTWKVESVLQENQSFEVSNANSSLFIPTNSSSTNIVIEEASLSLSLSQATISGSILPSGGSVISERGFCYSYSNPQPTVYDNLTSLGSSTGSFENDYSFYSMEDTVMYVRAFATNIEGITYSDVITYVRPSVYIGQELEGGIVFYIDETGEHGLVAALEDLGQFEWGCNGISISGIDGQAIGTGLQNTLEIVAGCSETPIAASEALAYESEGYSDWYIPSKDELQEMYNTIGNGGSEGDIGGFGNGVYWSSSEFNNNYAWYVNFNDGVTFYSYKGYPYRVRVIRAF
jgi:hypothetical protein